MVRRFWSWGLLAAVFASGCGEPGGGPTAPSAATTLSQGASPTIEVACPSLDGSPGCFSPPIATASGVGIAAIGAPQNLTVTVNGSILTYHWTAPSGGGVLSYVLEVGSSPGASNLVNFDTGNTATSLVSGNVPNGVYYSRVRARDASGLGAPSNEVKSTVGGSGGSSTKPNAPTGFSVSVNGSSVVLDWNAPSSGCPATSYILEVGSSPGSANLGSGDIGPATSVTGSAPPGTFYLRIRAKNSAGVGAPSNEVKVVIAGGGAGTLSVTRFVCFGDSMTDGGLGLSSGGYPDKLRSLLENRYTSQNFDVFNEAKGGERATNGQNRLPGVLDQWHPQVLNLLEGVNDLNHNINPIGAMSNMVNAARSRGIAVMLATLPPERSFAPGFDLLNDYNNDIRALATTPGVTLVDVFAALSTNVDSYISSNDGFHPTVAGHNKIGETFFNAIVARFQVKASSTTLTSMNELEAAGWRLQPTIAGSQP